MESWDLWDDFLAVIAAPYKLSPAETEAFKARFAKEYIDKEFTSEDVEKIAENLTIRSKKGEERDSIAAYKKRMTEVFKKFQAVIPHKGRDKSVTLLKWLKAQYIERQKHDHPEIKWPQICHDILTEQQKKQRLRRQATELGCELNVYVPLGLLERKQQQRRDESVPKDDVYQLNPQVIVKEYENQQFLTEVIQGGNNQRLAIIGEPGAGKTTLLAQIANWIDDNNLGLPICIPLGGLQGETLARYLLKIWLKQATKIEANQDNLAASLEQQFREGKVWLLLDAVDEMAAASPAEALAKIRDELVEWVAEARVVLTCRLNVWDASVNNPLPGFQTYRTLEFKPEQVDEFIGEWFAKAQQKNPLGNCLRKGEKLLAKLKETNRANIYNLVRSPLRLALLCQTFYLSPDEELPETQAMLYERFIRYFYEWKQEQHSTTRAERQQLNQVLGELAKAGIESESRFRLRESWAIQLMGESQFKLAEKLGWLNLVDRDAKTDEAVYAFFHPTFQEYFAAKAIEDWHFFLHHVPDNPKLGIYRIFERRWKEVMLLWVGRDDLSVERKEGFIKALVEFDEGCKDFYGCRAYFLGAILIAEFKDCSLADAILAEIIEWGFGYFNVEKQEWQTFIDPIADGAIEVLKETDRERAIAALVELICNSQYEDTQRQAIYRLGIIGENHPEAITVLAELVCTSQNELNRLLAADSLGRIDKNNSEAIAALVELIHNSQDESTRLQAVEILRKIDKNNPEAIPALLHLIRNSQDEITRSNAAYSLGETADKENRESIAVLVELISTSKDKLTQRQAVESLGKIAKYNPEAIAALVDLIASFQDEDTRREAAYSLGKIDTYKPKATAVLVELVRTSASDNTWWLAIKNLVEIDRNNPSVIATLVESIHSCQFEEPRRQAAQMLGEIDKNNPVAIATLVELIHTSNHESKQLWTAYSLLKIDKNNPIAIEYLVNLIHTSQDVFIRWQSAESLGKIYKKYPEALATLVRLIRTPCQHELILINTPYSLEKILIVSKAREIGGVVSALKDSLSDETYNNDSDRFKCCYKVLWKCAQNLPYPTFYEAWHHPPTTPHPEVLETTAASATPTTITLNWQTFPQDIARAINNDANLSHHLKPISIDINKFLDPDNPAAKIYSEMLWQGCPKSQDSKPKTLAELQTYWDELRIESDIFPLLIFYDSQTGTENATAFSNTFLKALSKFDGFICAVCDAADISLPTFSPSQPNLIANMIGWMREKMMES